MQIESSVTKIYCEYCKYLFKASFVKTNDDETILCVALILLLVKWKRKGEPHFVVSRDGFRASAMRHRASTTTAAQ